MMATQHSFPDSATDAFKIAIQNFKKALKDDKVYAEILQTTSVEQVYDLTDKLQAEQMKRNGLKGLSKIKPYLERLEAYTGAIDTFVQVKPEILALIWGPIRLLIQWASLVSASLVGLINMAAQIGYLLPEFGHAKRMFGDKEQINLLLALFFQDILDFYSVALKFFSMPRLNFVFEALWPKKKTEIEHILDRIGRHTTMLRNEVGLEHIQAAYIAREDELQHFKQLHRKATRTEYGILEAAIAPTYYDKKLVELRGRLCDGTGDWLLKHSTIQQWLHSKQDESGSTPRVVWLRGIPGAGKTFLAACVIREIQFTDTECKRIVFAFLTHALTVSTTALSIIHSLIFQLARDDHIDSSGHAAQEESILQDFISGTSRAALTSDLGTAVDLLIKLLKASGPVHIVIDGLDEIDESERDQFLVRVLRVSESCQDARILIASRDEDDIKAALVSKAIEIRADTCNESSIRTYVTSRFHKWVQSRGFSADEKDEITSLLHPIATQAKGMFMYAELILKGLDYLDTIDEIRDELIVLPRDLNAAYGRIFSRINQKLPTQHAREKARKILGWVGCSPLPLTIQELEQALSIRVGDFNQIPRGYSTLKIVRLCGPVVEVIDNEVHFVHFTAKEYFFDPTIVSHLRAAQYTLSLTKACLTYLCQPQYDPGLDKSSTTKHLVNGVYRLHHFATDAWLKLVEVCCLSKEVDKDSNDWRELLDLVRQLRKSRSSEMYKPPDEEPDLLRLKALQDSDVEVYKILCREAQFREKSEIRLFDVGSVEWRASDPLTLRRTSAAVQCALDEKTCPTTVHARHTIDSESCFGDTIRLNYGLRLYKCPFISCRFHRTGFEDKRLRHAHSKDHDRPWRCDVSTCEYFKIGFISRPMRDEHLDKVHSADEACQLIPTTGDMSPDHSVSLILALIRANKVQAVQSLLDKLSLADYSPYFRLLCTEVAILGSPEMLRIMYAKLIPRSDSQFLFPIFLKSAIESGNLSINEWLDGDIVHLTAPRLHPERYICVVVSALKSESFHSTMKSLEPLTIRIYQESRRRVQCFQPGLVAATRNCPRREDALIALWEKLEKIDRTKLSDLSTGLSSVAATTFSLKLAGALLEFGACVDGHGSGKKHPTPLQRAASRDSMESAIFMRFLLRHGADPNVEYRKTAGYEGDPKHPNARCGRVYHFKAVQLSEEVGPKEISRWLGKSWEEVLEESREARGAKGTSIEKENC